MALAVGAVQAQLGNDWVTPTRGLQAGMITLSPTYTLSFEIQPVRRVGGWASVLHIGAASNVRAPGIWFHSSAYSFHICYDQTPQHGQVCIDTRELAEGEVSYVSINVDAATNTMTAYINGESWGSVRYSSPDAGGTHPLWVSDPWYTAANCNMRRICLIDGIVSASSDPHLSLSHGVKADLLGEHKVGCVFLITRTSARISRHYITKEASLSSPTLGGYIWSICAILVVCVCASLSTADSAAAALAALLNIVVFVQVVAPRSRSARACGKGGRCGECCSPHSL